MLIYFVKLNCFLWTKFLLTIYFSGQHHGKWRSVSGVCETEAEGGESDGGLCHLPGWHECKDLPAKPWEGGTHLRPPPPTS